MGGVAGGCGGGRGLATGSTVVAPRHGHGASGSSGPRTPTYLPTCNIHVTTVCMQAKRSRKFHGSHLFAHFPPSETDQLSSMLLVSSLLSSLLPDASLLPQATASRRQVVAGVTGCVVARPWLRSATVGQGIV